MKKYGKLSASIVLCTFLAVLLIGVKKGAAEDTVIHAGQSGDLTWEIHDNYNEGSSTCLIITGKGDYDFYKDDNGNEYPSWMGYKEDITQAVIKDVNNITTLKNCFYGMDELREVTFSNVDTSQVTNMSGMFRNCKQLTKVNWGEVSTENVTDMSRMFEGCDFIDNLDLTFFNTGKVKNMSSMFRGCSNLFNINISSFDTAHVTDMSWMFYGLGNSGDSYACETTVQKYVTLDVSSFNTSSVMNMSRIFSDACIENLDLNGFDTSSVTNMSGMFSDSHALLKIKLSSINTSNVTDMSYMFDDCWNLLELDTSSFDTSSVTNMDYMFYQCAALEELDVSSWNTSLVQSMYRMFTGCRNLKDIDVSSFDTSSVNDMDEIFDRCESLEKLDLSSFESLCGSTVINIGTKLKMLYTPKNILHPISIRKGYAQGLPVYAYLYRADTGEKCEELPLTNGQSILLVTEDLLDATLRPDPDEPIESIAPDPIESVSPSPTAKPSPTASVAPSPEGSAVPSPGESKAPSSTASVIPTESASAIPSVQPTIKVDYYMEGSFTGWGGEEAYPSSKGHAQDSGDPNFYYADRTNIVVGKGYNCGLELMNPYNDLFTGAENEMSEFIQKMKTPVIRVTLENSGTASAWNWHTELSIPSGEEVILTKEYLDSGYFALFGNDDTITKVEFYDKGEISEPSPSPSVEPTTKPTAKPTAEPAEKPTQEPTASAPSSADTEPPATQTPVPEKSGSPNETPMPTASEPAKTEEVPSPTASAAPTKPVYRVNIDGDDDEYAPSKPAKVKIKKASPLKRGKVKVTWKKVTGADWYIIQYSTKRSFSGSKVGIVYGKKTTLRLKKKKTYYIRILACKYGNSANNYRAVKGKWSKVKKVKTKA